MTLKVGMVTFYSADDYYRPSLWVELPRSQLVVFFGWQLPSVQWLR